MRLEDMAEPPTATASTNIDPEILGFIPAGTYNSVKEIFKAMTPIFKEVGNIEGPRLRGFEPAISMKGYKDCKLCEGTGEIECALEVFGSTICDGKTVACPVCLEKRYKKRIKELKGE